MDKKNNTQLELLTQLVFEAEENVKRNGFSMNCKMVAEHLIANNVIVLPGKRVFFVVDNGTPYAMVMSKSIEELPLYIIQNLKKNGYYFDEKEAKAAIKTNHSDRKGDLL